LYQYYNFHACYVYGENDGPEAVVVCSLGVIVEDLPSLVELVSFDVELIVRLSVPCEDRYMLIPPLI